MGLKELPKSLLPFRSVWSYALCELIGDMGMSNLMK
jgi:hypothetical protein